MNRANTYVIAEMACSHEGDPSLARKIITAAGSSGADAVQFQIWQIKKMMVPHHKDYQWVSKLELSQDEWRGLASFVRENFPAMQIIACVNEAASVEFTKTLGVDAYKIHSSDLSNPGLIRMVAETGKRIDLSVGGSTIGEIQSALEWIRASSDSEIWLMYGYQNFPTKFEEIHLDYMMKLQELFELPMGYQDHSDADHEAAFWLPAAALGMGVPILEKHITHDRSFKGVDHEAALNPEEFHRFMEMVRTIEAAKGVAVPKPFTDEEIKYRKYAKKSIVAARDLAPGETIAEADLAFMRTNDLGLPPDAAPELVGRVVASPVKRYGRVREEHLK